MTLLYSYGPLDNPDVLLYYYTIVIGI